MEQVIHSRDATSAAPTTPSRCSPISRSTAGTFRVRSAHETIDPDFVAIIDERVIPMLRGPEGEWPVRG